MLAQAGVRGDDLQSELDVRFNVVQLDTKGGTRCPVQCARNSPPGDAVMIQWQQPLCSARRSHSAGCVCRVMVAAWLAATVQWNDAPAAEPCRIQIVDAESKWPVPLVELRTVNEVRFVSDNAGVIAFDLPEAMGRETWFFVKGHGYTVPADGFNYRGVRLIPAPGKTLTVEVQRTIIAKRIGRITGSGLYGESQKSEPRHNAWESGVLGADSVQNAVHNGRMYWFWGDTNLAHYPLGIFHASGATSAVEPLESFTPPLRLRLDYFRDAHGKPRAVANMPGTGPTWLTGVISLPDRQGQGHLLSAYMKVKPPLEAYEWGLAEWDDGRAAFVPLRTVWTKSESAPKPPPLPEGHPVLWTDEHGAEWALFGNPFPTLKCPARYEAWQDPTTWTPLVPPEVLTDAEGNKVKPHSGSIAWNPFRQRWVTVFMQQFGKPSAFGELWYAEARSPFGPWGTAVKVLSHDNYTFYNPRLHPEFTAQAPRVLLFEGTYTATFAHHAEPTPRYDYNQVLYRLDLDDPALSAAHVP